MALQRIALPAPVVLHRFAEQGLFVGHQFFVEQTAAVKRVLPEGALCPGIDGEDAGLIHALGGHGEAPGCLLTLRWPRVVGQQILQETVLGFGGDFCAKTPRSLQQPRPDPVREFPRGRPREGHHQDVRGHQRASKACVIAAVSQDQAHIQGSNGPGLAGASTGFDQTRAPEGKANGLKRFCHVGVLSARSVGRPVHGPVR